MAIFRGLNIAKGMADVDNPREALANLGLNRDDFDLIAGLTSPGNDVTITDFHSTSGLVTDSSKELAALAGAAERSGELIDTMNDVRIPMDFNLSINNKLAGNAIKFNYLDFNDVQNNLWTEKGADISTSRISSWSPVGDPNPEDYILYGGELKITGHTITFTTLRTDTAPIAKKFRAEVPTHIIKLRNTGASNAGSPTTHQFLVMKGIPLSWDAYFRDANLSASIKSPGLSDSLGTIPMTWQITNLDNSPGGPYNSGDNTVANPGNIGIGTYSTPSTYAFRDTASRPRRLEFFYDPSYIEKLEMTYLNLIDWTNVSLPELRSLNLEGNDLSVLPEFRSDATTAKAGFSGGKGLATKLEEITLTGNNLTRAAEYLNGRGFDSTTSVTAGTANAQLNRLPLTIKKIVVNGCFADTTTINLKDYTSLENFTMDSDYQRDLSRRQPNQDVSPEPYDPLGSTGAQPFGTIFKTDATDTVDLSFMDDPDTAFGLVDGATTAFVRLDYRTNEAGDFATATSSKDSNMTDEAVLMITKTVGNTAKKYKLTTVGLSHITLTATEISAMSGVYSLTHCDTNGDNKYIDTGGIKTYRINKQSYRQLSPGVYNSKNTTYVDIRLNRMSTNAQYPHFDADLIYRANSSADAAIPAFRSDNLTHFYSEHNSHNPINMSNKPNLKVYHHRQNDTLGNYQIAEKTFDGKFDNIPNLEVLNCYNFRRAAGDYSTNGMFKNKPKLRFLDFRWGWGLKGALRDDILAGSNKVQLFLTAGSAKSPDSNDMFATSGSDSLHQGNTFVNSPELTHFYFYYNWKSSGRIVNPNNPDYSLDLSQCPNLRYLYLAGNDLAGTLPDFSANRQLRYLNVIRNSWNKELRFGHEGQTYKIYQLKGTPKAIWESIGWVANSTDPVDGTSIGSNPANGDHFVAQNINVTNTQLQASERYRIRDLGTTSTSDWQSLGLSGTPSIGKEFTTSGTAPSTVAGNGKVWPARRYDRIKSRGLTGVFPTLDHEYLYTILARDNTFGGQMPKHTLKRTYTFQFQSNEFSGDIPDFSECPKLRTAIGRNNRMSSYTSGNLASCTNMRNFDFSNNRLEGNISTALIYDLYENYLARPRGGVTINFLGQVPDNGVARLSEASIINDGTGGLEESSANKLATLRSNGWTILLDAT